MDSGVSDASRSSTFLPSSLGSRVDWISSAFAWALVTSASASEMNFLKTS
jgi:hypothetical protein